MSDESARSSQVDMQLARCRDENKTLRMQLAKAVGHAEDALRALQTDDLELDVGEARYNLTLILGLDRPAKEKAKGDEPT